MRYALPNFEYRPMIVPCFHETGRHEEPRPLWVLAKAPIEVRSNGLISLCSTFSKVVFSSRLANNEASGFSDVPDLDDSEPGSAGEHTPFLLGPLDSAELEHSQIH